MIKRKIKELESLKNQNEGVSTMLASEEILKKDWDNDLDERWDNICRQASQRNN